MRDRLCPEKGVQYFDLASVMVEDDGAPHTIIFCTKCNNLRQDERKEPVVSNKRWKIVVAEKRSRGKLSAGLDTRGFESRIWEWLRGRRGVCEKLTGGRGDGTEIGQQLDRGVAVQRRALLRESTSLHLPDIMVRRAIRAGRADDLSEPMDTCPRCHRYPFADYIWWVSTGHGTRSATGGARHAAAGATGMERSKQSPGRTGQRGSQRGEGVSGARPATWCVREYRVSSQVLGEPSDGWRQPRENTVRRFAGAGQVEKYE